MVLEDDILKLKEKGKVVGKLFGFFGRVLTGKSVFLIMSLLLFITSVFFFAKFEFIDNPERFEIISREGKNAYFETFYWLITTAATVGYGDITPQTTEGKILAMVVMVLGVSLLGFLLSQLTQRIVSSNLGNIFGLNKIKGRVDYIICRWDMLSEAIMGEIRKKGGNIVVIDKENRPKLAREKNVNFILGDPIDKDSLAKANIKMAKNVILNMDKDAESILGINIIRELNPWVNIIARIDRHEHVSLAKDAGADMVVSPASIGGRLISIASEEPNLVRWVLDSFTKEGRLKLMEYDVKQGSSFANKKLTDLKKVFGKNAKVVGIDTAEGLNKVPKDDYIIEQGDRLILLANKEKLKAVLKE